MNFLDLTGFQLASLERRLMARVVKTSYCWNWTGPDRKKNGYGGIQVGREIILVHRLSYVLFVGPLLEGEKVLHKCDNDKCVNPDHLFTGDLADNNADRAAKSRSAIGEEAGSSKLTERQVLEIRLAEGFSISELSRKYDVHPQTITKILLRETWRHI